jgi:iron complex outermembrane receptor protein
MLVPRNPSAFRPDLSARKISAWLRRLGSATVLSCAVAAGQADAEATDLAAAEDSDAARSSNPAILETITVTAGRRMQRQQDVPYSVQAIDANTIRNNDIQSFEDYVADVPGLSYGNGGAGRSDLYLRGVSSPSVGQSTVGLYLDEIPMAFAGFQPDLNLFDMQRIEILKGPQGTLYGEGALGGALKMITNKPNLSTFEAAAEGTYSGTAGGQPNNNVSGMINLPLLQGHLGLRLVVGRHVDGGWIDNPRIGQKDVNDGDGDSVRAELRWVPIESLDVLFTYAAQHSHYDAEPFIDYGSTQYDVQNRAFNEANSEGMTTYNLTANYSASYGTWTISSSRMRRSLQELLDLETSAAQLDAAFGTTGLVIPNQQVSYFDIDSDEVRFTSPNSGAFKWVAGAFYKERREPFVSHVPTPSSIIPFVGTDLYLNVVDTSDKERALFGEGTYDLTSRLHLTAGGRLSHETDHVRSDLFVFYAGQIPTQIGDASYSSFTPRVSLSYDVSKGNTVYATVAKGYRSGGANYQIDPTQGDPLTFRPDSVINYEIGDKASWLSDRVFSELAVYHMDWKDIQVFQQSADGARSFTVNGGKASSNGLEWTVSARPIEHFDVAAGVSLIHATYGTAVPAANVVRGDRLPFSPASSFSVSAGYKVPVGGSTDGFVRAEYQHTGSRLSSARDEIAGFGNLDLRAGLTWKQCTLTLFAKNMTNEHTLLDTIPAGGAVSIVNHPRLIGVTVRADF